MEEWKSACKEALWLATRLGLEDMGLAGAIDKSDVDEALAPLSSLVMMLSGALAVLKTRASNNKLTKETDAALKAMVHAFEVATATDCPPMEAACSAE